MVIVSIVICCAFTGTINPRYWFNFKEPIKIIRNKKGEKSNKLIAEYRLTATNDLNQYWPTTFKMEQKPFLRSVSYQVCIKKWWPYLHLSRIFLSHCYVMLLQRFKYSRIFISLVKKLLDSTQIPPKDDPSGIVCETEFGTEAPRTSAELMNLIKLLNDNNQEFREHFQRTQSNWEELMKSKFVCL